MTIRHLFALALVTVLLAGGDARAQRPQVGDAGQLALIESLPERRAAIQEAGRHKLEHGVTAEMHEALGAIIDFLGLAWLELAAIWPEDHFGTPDHATYLDTFILSRIAFYRAINTFDDEEAEGTLLGIIIATRLAKDLDAFVADTATAQLARHDPVLSLGWLSQWQEAQR